MLVAVSIARTRCEMWRGEGEDGNEDLSSDEDRAITPSCDGSVALSRERQGENRRVALAAQELDPSLGSGLMLLVFICVPSTSHQGWTLLYFWRFCSCLDKSCSLGGLI